MRRFARYLTAFMLVTAVAAWGLTSIVAYKTFTREILTSADLNSSFSRVITAANNLIALHPGDSTVTVRGVFDTLDASPGPNLNVIRTMVFRDNQDSLVVPGRISADTVKVDDQLWLGMTASVVGFSGGATAGTRLTFGSLVGVDSLRVRDSLNVQPGARSYLPRARIDSLLSGTATATVGFASSFTAGSRLNLGSVVRADSIWTGTTTPVVGFTAGSTAGTRFLWAYAKHDSNVVTWSDVNGGTIDGTVIGGATAAAGSFTSVSGSIAASFTGGLTTNTLKVTGALALTALRDTVMDAVRDTVAATALAFSDGTSALPAITNLGDLNTGIDFPAADQVGIAVNGVRALLVSGDDITVRDDINVGDDLLLPATGVVNWGAGDVTVTGGTNTLTFAGATGYAFNGTLNNALQVGGAQTDGAGIKVYPTTTVANPTVAWFYPTYGGGNGSDRTIYAYSIANANNSSEMNGLRTFGLINGGVTLANYHSVYISNPTATGTLTNNYGIYIESQTSGGTDYAAWFGGGAVNIQQLDASSAVSTDASKNLTTASDSSWKVDRGELVDATTILRGLRPRYWTWKKDSHGLLTDPRRPAPWARTRAEAWTQITGTDSTTALSQAAPGEHEALRAKVRKVKTLEDQPRLAGFFAQEVYSAFPEGSPGGANVDSLGVEHWGLNTTAILAAVTASLQEQIDRVDSLTVVTARQDSLISALAARVTRLEAR